jgi:hypothetical protein
MTGEVRSQEQQRAWQEHNLSQLQYFRSLSLREKLEAVEGMADVVRRLQEMRERGELKSASDAESDGRYKIDA